MMDIVQTVQQNLECDSIQLVTELVTMNSENLDSTLTNNASHVVKTAWKMYNDLLFQFTSRFYYDSSTNAMSETDGYPAWWLKPLGFSDRPPPPPTLTKCFHLPVGLEDDGHGSGNGNVIIRRERYGDVVMGKDAMKAFLRDLKSAQTT